jgi:hypothetical protein
VFFERKGLNPLGINLFAPSSNGCKNGKVAKKLLCDAKITKFLVEGYKVIPKYFFKLEFFQDAFYCCL